MALITLERARTHLRLPAAADDADLALKVEQASAIVLAFIARPNDATWTAEIAAWGQDGSPVTAVPPVVQAAVLMEVADLYTHRGDERFEAAGIAPEVEALLRATGYRDPILA